MFDRQSDLAGTWVVAPGAEAAGAVTCWLTGAIAMLSGANACCGAATCTTCIVVSIPTPCSQCMYGGTACAAVVTRLSHYDKAEHGSAPV